MDNKVYPTNEQITFIVAEDVRAEAIEGKFTIVGAFPARVLAVALPPDLAGDKHKGVQFPSIAVLFTFGDGAGAFKVKAELRNAEGKDLLEGRGDEREINKPQNSPVVLVFHFKPFPISFGEHKLRIQVDDRVYERSFTVVQSKAD